MYMIIFPFVTLKTGKNAIVAMYFASPIKHSPLYIYYREVVTTKKLA